MRPAYLLFIFAAFIFSSCDKDEPPPPKLGLISFFMKPFMFDSASYWIYADSISGQTDSMFIIDSEMTEKLHFTRNNKFLVQEYEMRYNHFFGPAERTQIVVGNSLFLDRVPDGPLLYFLNEPPGIPFGDHIGLSADSTIYVLGKEYTHCKVNQWNGYNAQSGSDYKVLYFHDSIGVVRCEEFKNNQAIRVWNLSHFSAVFPAL